MAREMNKEQLKYIMENKPEDMEIEIFIHGAICFAYSGRCFLSDFLSGRSANLGDCAQSCRWSYNLYAEEKNNPGQNSGLYFLWQYFFIIYTLSFIAAFALFTITLSFSYVKILTAYPMSTHLISAISSS